MAGLRIIALDLSLAGTGIAWTCDHHGRSGLGARTVRTRRAGHERLHDILVDVAAACRCNPHLAVVEGLPLYVGKGDVTIRLAELHGVVKHWLWTKSIPYVDVEPSSLKMWATGKGNATKTGVREAITATYGAQVHIGDDNQADSVALLSMAAHIYGQPLATVLNPKQLRAVDPVTWPTLDPATGGAADQDRRPSRPAASVS